MNVDDYETLPTQSVGTHMTAGAFAGVMEHCVMYPLDSVKTRMQSLGATQNTSILQTLGQMVRNEGVFRDDIMHNALNQLKTIPKEAFRQCLRRWQNRWEKCVVAKRTALKDLVPVRGMSAVVIGAGPAHALYFSTYEYSKDKLSHFSNQQNLYIYGISGSLASVVHDAVSNPTEVVKQRLQMYNSPYRNVFHCIRQTYRMEGMRAFYRSYTTQLFMNVPFQSLYFTTYEFMQNITNKKRTYNPKAHVISGAVAGAIAAGVTTPLDVCKTVLNTQEKQARAKGFVEAVQYINKISGPRGFFKGMLARVLYQMPAAAICWSTYETFKFLLSRDKEDAKMALLIGEKEKLSLRLVLPQASVMAENGKSNAEPPREPEGLPRNIKTMELPAVSGANLYGALSLNTIHQSDAQNPSLRHR